MQVNKTYTNQGIIDIAPCVSWLVWYWVGDTDTRNILQAMLLFLISKA